jgi:hypothetical protein
MAAAISLAGNVGDFDIVAVAPDNSYPTGGYDVSAFLGPQDICMVVGVTPSANQALWVFNPSTKKLMAFGTAVSASGLTQIANAVDLSGQVVRLLVA